MARLIKVGREYVDGDGKLKEEFYYFTPLKMKHFKKYASEISKFQDLGDDENLDMNKQSEIFSKISELMYDLFIDNHKNVAKEEFDELFAIEDFMYVMSKAMASGIEDEGKEKS